MSELSVFLPNILLIYATYVIATASPGPATLAIMTISMSQGRKAGIVFSLGIFTGSMTWAILAFSGLTELIKVYSSSLIFIKIVGGLYLLWMAYKALKSALSATLPKSKVTLDQQSIISTYTQALVLHLTNPKAAFVWLAIASFGIQETTPLWVSLSIVAGCGALGLTVFITYAFIFSSQIMIAKYKLARRPIESAMAMVFGYAGFKLITDKI